MDQTAFDRIARILGGESSRRSSLRATIAGLAGLAAPPALASDGPANQPAATGKNRGSSASKDKAKDKGKTPRPEGPCGDGSRKDNRCIRNSQCCTGYCEKNLKNRDGDGRCRCVGRNMACKQDQTCCHNAACVDGVCRVAVATGKPCNPARDTCADPAASCTSYTYSDASHSGPFCVLPRAAACAASDECESRNCDGGVCALCSSPVCVTACTPVVCLTCPHQTVQAAINAAAPGAVVTIGAGLYIENLTVSRDLTLRACPGSPVTIRNTAYGNRTVTVTGGASLTIIGIVIDGLSDPGSNPGGGILTDGALQLVGNAVVRNASWEDGGGVYATGDNRTVTITDQVIIESNHAANFGGGVLVEGLSALVVSGAAVITGNAADSYGAGLAATEGANVTISGNVVLRANAGGGAALFVRRGDATRAISVIVEDDVLITGNAAINGKDGGFARFANHGATDTRIPMDVLIRGRVAITNNTAEGDGGAISSRWAAITLADSVVISGNRTDNGGGGVWIAPKANGTTWPAGVIGLTIRDNVRVTGNTGPKGGGCELSGTACRMAGNALVSGNSVETNGGGFLLSYRLGSPASLALADAASITANTAASGGGVYSSNAGNTLTAVSGSITGNTPDNCTGGTISC
ncbi:MAG: hypothetical protein ACKOWF_13225 [Chloroflexota bacterium]